MGFRTDRILALLARSAQPEQHWRDPSQRKLLLTISMRRFCNYKSNRSLTYITNNYTIIVTVYQNGRHRSRDFLNPPPLLEERKGKGLTVCCSLAVCRWLSIAAFSRCSPTMIQLNFPGTGVTHLVHSK